MRIDDADKPNSSCTREHDEIILLATLSQIFFNYIRAAISIKNGKASVGCPPLMIFFMLMNHNGSARNT